MRSRLERERSSESNAKSAMHAPTPPTRTSSLASSACILIRETRSLEVAPSASCFSIRSFCNTCSSASHRRSSALASPMTSLSRIEPLLSSMRMVCAVKPPLWPLLSAARPLGSSQPSARSSRARSANGSASGGRTPPQTQQVASTPRLTMVHRKQAHPPPPCRRIKSLALGGRAPCRPPLPLPLLLLLMLRPQASCDRRWDVSDF